jgi:hypothetical protein
VPELARALDPEEARAPSAIERPVTLEQSLLAHHPLGAREIGLSISREVRAATILVPSVGLSFATSTIASSTGPETGLVPGSVRLVGVR